MAPRAVPERPHGRRVAPARVLTVFVLLVALDATAIAQIDSDAAPVDTHAAATDTSDEEETQLDPAALARLPRDTSTIVVRMPSPSVMSDVLADDDLKYGDDYENSESLWDTITRAISRLFASMLRETGSTFWDIVAYIVLGATILLVVSKLYGDGLTRLFFRSRREREAAAALEHEDVHGIAYEDQIAAATAAGDYRSAIRLHYLRALRDLSDAGSIAWRRNKTDHDYVRDLAGSPLQSDFERAAMLFTYVWYGDFPVDRASYERIARLIDRVGAHAAAGPEVAR